MISTIEKAISMLIEQARKFSASPIAKAISMMIEQAQKDSDSGKIDLDEKDLVGVFNDAVIMMWLEDDELKIKVVVGEPMKFDYSLNLIEQ